MQVGLINNSKGVINLGNCQYFTIESIRIRRRVPNIVATHRASHVPLEPSINAAHVETVLAVSNGAHFGIDRNRVLADGAYLPVLFIPLNNGSTLDLFWRWTNNDRVHGVLDRRIKPSGHINDIIIPVKHLVQYFSEMVGLIRHIYIWLCLWGPRNIVAISGHV